MLSEYVVNSLKKSSGIRAMFEEGITLKAKYGAENVYDFSLGNPDPPPPKKVQEILQALVAENGAGLHSYMSNAGYTDVRESIAAHINKTDGTALAAENIIMTVGAGGGLNVALKAILNPGEEVIVFSPYFVEYNFYIENHGGRMILLPTDSETFLPDAGLLEKNINKKTKAVILNSPNNPTGVVYDEQTLKALSEVLEKKQAEYGTTIFLLSDEPYRDIVYDGVAVPSVLRIFRNAMMVYSFSKSLSLPGERIGYIAASSRIDSVKLLVDALVFANRSLGFVNAPSLFQKVVAQALDEKVDANIYRERRDMLYSHLTGLGFSCIQPQGAFYLFPKTPLADTAEFKQIALKHRIILVPGAGFGCPDHFRIAYCVGLETIKNSLSAFTELAAEIGLKQK